MTKCVGTSPLKLPAVPFVYMHVKIWPALRMCAAYTWCDNATKKSHWLFQPHTSSHPISLLAFSACIIVTSYFPTCISTCIIVTSNFSTCIFYLHYRHILFLGFARTVYHLFKHRIYRMYFGIYRIKPYSVYTEKLVPFRFHS